MLFANRIGRPEFILSRLIVIGYKSNDINERTNEDYNIKIYEIFKNFMLVYCLYDKTHIKSIVKAILIIITAHLLNDSSNYERSVLNNFNDTKFEFLNGLLKHLCQYGPHKIPIRKMIFKIFKYLYFLAFYILEDHEKILSGDYKENSNNKKINITYSIKKRIKQDLKKFFEKSNYDKFLVAEMNEENFLKLFPFILNLEEISLKSISEPLYEKLETLKENNYIYECSGKTVDLSNEEKMNEFREYVNNKEIKYFKTFEDSYVFLNSLKEDKLNVIYEEKSFIHEDEDVSGRTSLNNSIKSHVKKNTKKSNVEDTKTIAKNESNIIIIISIIKLI